MKLSLPLSLLALACGALAFATPDDGTMPATRPDAVCKNVCNPYFDECIKKNNCIKAGDKHPYENKCADCADDTCKNAGKDHICATKCGFLSDDCKPKPVSKSTTKSYTSTVSPPPTLIHLPLVRREAETTSSRIHLQEGPELFCSNICKPYYDNCIKTKNCEHKSNPDDEKECSLSCITDTCRNGANNFRCASVCGLETKDCKAPSPSSGTKVTLALSLHTEKAREIDTASSWSLHTAHGLQSTRSHHTVFNTVSFETIHTAHGLPTFKSVYTAHSESTKSHPTLPARDVATASSKTIHTAHGLPSTRISHTTFKTLAFETIHTAHGLPTFDLSHTIPARAVGTPAPSCSRDPKVPLASNLMLMPPTSDRPQHCKDTCDQYYYWCLRVNDCANCPGSISKGDFIPSDCSEKCIIDTCNQGLDDFLCNTECGYESEQCKGPVASFFVATIINPQPTPKAADGDLHTMSVTPSATLTAKSKSTSCTEKHKPKDTVTAIIPLITTLSSWDGVPLSSMMSSAHEVTWTATESSLANASTTHHPAQMPTMD